jgi:hypothetical protein
MKITSLSISHQSWHADNPYHGSVTLQNDDGSQINLVLPQEVTHRLLDTVTKHVTKTAQTRSVEFFNGMQNIGLPALEHQPN